MEDVKLDEVQWRSPEWIQSYGLRTDNVLEYFALSPFYDRSSNNQVLKMQTVFNENLQGRVDIQKELKKMRGLEFVVAIAQEPDLWVIRKQNRESPTEAQILDTYFVVGESVYKAPSVHSILTSRLLATSLSLSKAVKVAETLPVFTPNGYTYTHDRETPQTEAKSEDASNGQEEDDSALGEANISLERAFTVSLVPQRH